MEHIVYSPGKSEYRYGSGMTLYSEAFRNGRLLALEFHAAGMPQNTGDRVKGEDLSAFRLEIDGQDMTYDWTLLKREKRTAPDGRPFGTLALKHDRLPVELTITTFCGNNGYYTRKMSIRNASDRMLSITRVSPLCGALWEMADEIPAQTKDGDAVAFSIGGFQGRHWGMEGQFQWFDVAYNSALELSSATGRSGHTHPFAIAHSHLLGGYFVCQLEWSGNWGFRFENVFHYAPTHSNHFLRLNFELGPRGVAPMRVIDPGETVEIPAVHFGYTYADFDGAIQRLHAYQRQYILAKSPRGKEYLSYDPWGYEGWDANEKRYLSELERAKTLGAEMFVVDAGWYGKPGSNWWETVGDWDIPRMPNDLFPVINKVHEYGMAMGLWVEPEAVGAESELVRKHPDWLMKRYGQSMERCLDMSKPEVEAYIKEQLTNLVERYQLDMLRLDYNNASVNEGGFNQRGDYSENNNWRCVEAIHRIFDHLRKKFPMLILENCASGGGRTDLGMMSRFSMTQISDWYRFPRIPRTFNGMTMCLPPEHIMGHYGAGMSQIRYGCAETHLQQLVQTVPRICGIAPWDEPVNPALIELYQRYIALYKSFIRPIQQVCKVWHHTPAVPGISGRGYVVQEFSHPDGTRGYASVMRLPDTVQNTYLLKTRGLDRNKGFKVTLFSTDTVFEVAGYQLATEGLPIYLDGPLTSELILMETINA